MDPVQDGGFEAADARLDASSAGPAVARALARLKPGDRETLLLFAWADLSYEEIGDALSIPIGTVRSRLHRARRQVHEILAASDSLLLATTSGHTNVKEAPMDDLDLVKRFREGVAPPGPNVIRAARMSMTADDVEGREALTPRRRRSRRNGWRVAVGVAAAAVAIAVVVPAILPGTVRAARTPRRQRRSIDSRGSPRRQPATAAPQPGQFVYTRSESLNESTWVLGSGDATSTFTRLQPVTREAWIGVDGSGRLRETTGHGSFPTPADEAAWKAAGSPDLGEGKTSDEMFAAGPQGSSFLDLSGLPTDPGALRAAIESRQIEGGPPGDAETFTIVGDLLRETYASPGAARGAVRGRCLAPGGATGRGHDRCVRTPWDRRCLPERLVAQRIDLRSEDGRAPRREQHRDRRGRGRPVGHDPFELGVPGVGRRGLHQRDSVTT